MAWQEHQIASAHDNVAGYENFEDYFAAPFQGDRVPYGAEASEALSGDRRWDGNRVVNLRTGGCSWDELDAYVTEFHGGWDDMVTEEVTLRCRKADNTYGDFNALAYPPVEGTHWERGTITEVIDLRLEYLILEEIVAP